MSTGIRHIDPAKVQLVRDRIARDLHYYHKLRNRLSRMFQRDDATQRAVVASCRAVDGLIFLGWAFEAGGDGAVDPADWCGDGI